MYILDSIQYRTASEINTAMSRVYMHTGLAVLTSLVVSMLVASSPLLMTFLFTGIMKWVVIFAPVVCVIGVSIALNANPPAPIALALLHGFASIMGLSFAIIFAVFKLGSIVSAFMGAAVLFGIMSFYGYFTRKSLDSWGKWLIIAVIAIFVSSLINIFLGSSLFQMILSAVAIVVFMGLTAYDTQKIRELLSQDTGTTVEITSALTLYMDFINIFLNMLQLFGEKKD